MYKRLILILAVIMLNGCAASADKAANAPANSNEIHEKHPNDPFEGFNRVIWTFNYDYLDPYFVRPVSIGYAKHTPSFLRTGIRNFIGNLEEPFKALNNLLTLDGKAALDHFNRFWINSSFGLAGILDIASKAGISQANDKQFGDVLGYYSVGQGPFLMVPFYGPLTIREGVGDMVDGLYPPLSLLSFPQSIIKGVFNGMETRASMVPQENMLNRSPDPYAFVRDAYLQHKAFRARGNKDFNEEELDEDFLDEELLNEVDDY